MTYASRTNRLIAQIIDDIIAVLPIGASSVVVRVGEGVGTILVLLAVLWALFYVFMSDGFQNGQSYGKRALGIRVVDEKTQASCSFGQSFLRNLLLAILGPIDWIFIFGDKHQRLGDKLAGTSVIVAAG